MFDKLPHQPVEINEHDELCIFHLRNKSHSHWHDTSIFSEEAAIHGTVAKDCQSRIGVEVVKYAIPPENFVTEEKCRELLNLALCDENIKLIEQPHDDPKMNRLERNKGAADICHRTRRGMGEYYDDEKMIAYIGAVVLDAGIVIATHDDKYAAFYSPHWREYFRRVM